METLSIKNRNESFHKLTDKLGERNKTAYNLIKKYRGLTSHQIKEKMILGLNQVSGRITELKDLFLIKESGSRKNEKSDCKNTFWVITSIEERRDLVDAEFIKLRTNRDEIIDTINTQSLKTYIENILILELKRVKKSIRNLERIS